MCRQAPTQRPRAATPGRRAFATSRTGPQLEGAFRALHERTQRALVSSGFLEPTPTQEACLPVCLRGTDVIVRARTGTGKTLGFLCAAAEKLARKADTTGVPRVQVSEN